MSAHRLDLDVSIICHHTRSFMCQCSNPYLSSNCPVCLGSVWPCRVTQQHSVPADNSGSQTRVTKGQVCLQLRGFPKQETFSGQIGTVLGNLGGPGHPTSDSTCGVEPWAGSWGAGAAGLWGQSEEGTACMDSRPDSQFTFRWTALRPQSQSPAFTKAQ